MIKKAEITISNGDNTLTAKIVIETTINELDIEDIAELSSGAIDDIFKNEIDKTNESNKALKDKLKEIENDKELSKIFYALAGSLECIMPSFDITCYFDDLIELSNTTHNYMVDNECGINEAMKESKVVEKLYKTIKKQL